jgi:REP element-mobilizing transposase RayT
MDLPGTRRMAELESSANWQPEKAAPHRKSCMLHDPVNKRSKHLISGFHSRGALPHLKQEGSCYFVTFRLTGTLPKDVLRQLKAEWQSLVPHPPQSLTWRQETGLFEWYSSRLDKYLDAGYGECWLRRPEIAEIVATALQFHAGVRFENHVWCLMPNHVHAVLRPLGDWSLSQILQSWKGYTAREANRILKRTGSPFWQVESFDHCIRDAEDLRRCCEYTIMNPVTAGLCARPEEWRWSSAYSQTARSIPRQAF